MRFCETHCKMRGLNTMENRKAKTDKPIENLEQDSLEVEKYINGLSKFIGTCNTPMTLAIQGDWEAEKQAS